MLVCDCIGLEYKDIKEAIEDQWGHFDNVLEAVEEIQKSIDAGTICGCCMEKECDKVDMLLLDAVRQAMDERIARDAKRRQ